MAIPSVLVLDSGVGGLSITGEIRARCPAVHIDYIADLAAFPYGVKPEEQIVDRITQLIKHAAPIYKPSVIVIACNTASTIALAAVRRITDIPVVGVVPAIKPAAQLSKTGVIGVLATEGTVSRRYTHDLIREFANNRTVVLHGSARLVELAEQKLQTGSVETESLEQELLPFFAKAPRMDTIVLACTHFPLFKNEFKNRFPNIEFWVDSGSAIASRVESLLASQTSGTISAKSSEPTNNFLITSASKHYSHISLEQYLGPFTERILSV